MAPDTIGRKACQPFAVGLSFVVAIFRPPCCHVCTIFPTLPHDTMMRLFDVMLGEAGLMAALRILQKRHRPQKAPKLYQKYI